MQVSIAGAGIAGLASAALLVRQGHAVTIYDQFPAPAPVGSGLMLQPVGMAVLDRLGLVARTLAVTSPVSSLYGETSTGRSVLDVRYSDLPDVAEGRAIQRSELFQMLLDTALEAGVDLVPGIEVKGASQNEEHAWIVTGNGPVGHADLLLDCLGAYSPLCPKPSRPLKYGALWALLDWPAEAAFAQDRLEQRYHGAERMVGILPVGQSPGGPLKLTFFWSLRGSDYPAWRAAPLDAWKAEVQDLWPETAPVLEQIKTHDDLTFAQYTHHTVGSPGQGRIAHLGDSFHATSPQLGQGANMALLDAAALADAVAQNKDPHQITKAYAKARRRHVWLYQSASLAFTPMYQSDSKVLPWLRDHFAAPFAMVWPMPQILAHLVAGRFGLKRRL